MSLTAGVLLVPIILLSASAWLSSELEDLTSTRLTYVQQCGRKPDP